MLFVPTPLASLLCPFNCSEMSATAVSLVLLPESRGPTVRVSILLTGRIVAAAMLVEPPIAGHGVMDVPVYSFLIEN